MTALLIFSLVLILAGISGMACGFLLIAFGEKPPAARGKLSIIEGIIKKTEWLSELNGRMKFPAAARYFLYLENKIRRAGVPFSIKPRELLSMKEVLSAVFSVSILALYGELNLFLVAVFFLLGFFYPDLWLDEKIRNRERQVLKDLPYTVDLLALCVEAGMDFTAAIARIASEGKGYLNDEFLRFVNELKLGKTRREALEDMGGRVGVEEFTNVTVSLITADEMGTGISKALRIISEEVSSRIAARMEKKAMEAPVKILLPLICFIFPAIFIIIFGPIIISGF